jgi:two-component system response regulator DevR
LCDAASWRCSNPPDIEIVGESGSAQEATRIIPALQPDVAVLDARLPDGDGVTVCRDVRSVDPGIKALMLTSYQDDEALFDSIMAGASGYLLKQVRGTDLVEAIRTVAAGRSLLDPSVTQQVLDRLRHADRHDPVELGMLTPQERRILDLIAQGMTNRQIGTELLLAEKTVKNYVSNLLAKLGVERRTQAAILANRLLARHVPPGVRTPRGERQEDHPGDEVEGRCGTRTAAPV